MEEVDYTTKRYVIRTPEEKFAINELAIKHKQEGKKFVTIGTEEKGFIPYPLTKCCVFCLTGYVKREVEIICPCTRTCNTCGTTVLKGPYWQLLCNNKDCVEYGKSQVYTSV